MMLMLAADGSIICIAAGKKYQYKDKCFNERGDYFAPL